MSCGAGELDKKITIQYKTKTRNTFGEEVIAWATFAAVWAGIKQMHGKELYASQQFHAESNYLVKIRYRKGVLPTMRVLYGAKIFDILYVKNVDEENVVMELLCKELV